MQLRRIRQVFLALAAACALGAAAVAAWILWPLPNGLVAPDPSPGLTLQDRHGLALRTTRAGDGSRMRWLRMEQIDPDLLIAFLAVEDRRFYEHSGVDTRAVGRALRDNLRAGRVRSGASTITMQLARLLHPRPAGRERALWSKAGEALWALRLERHLSKQEILEQYLNRVHLGEAATGVGAAADVYFGASASELSLGQAAMLAGLAHAPARDNPLASPRRARARRSAALARIRARGSASAAEVLRADAEPVAAPGERGRFLAPHFTARALSWARDSAALGTAGSVRTSLDLDLQEAAETEVRLTVEQLADRGVRHAAAVVLDNATGEVLAWVGSPDFWADSASGQTDMVVSPRQPGSALKPFLYGLAFDRGFTPASVLPDVARSYVTTRGIAYQPRNYDRRFHGPVRAREALASSYNVPAVELVEQLGAGALLNTLRLAGFSSLSRSAEHYGLGLALGNGDVTLLELANGYRALANGGAWRPYRWRPVAPGEHDEGPRRVMSAAAAALVLDILADPAARIPGFGVETPFEFPFPVAVKTGTSRHFSDNWAVGVTAGFTVAVWAGNFSGEPMDGVSGVTGAGPLLHRIVSLAARRRAPGVLPAPSQLGARALEVCRVSGLRAGARCPRATEWVQPGAAHPGPCDWHDHDGRLTLPAEYAEWQGSAAAARPVPAPPPPARRTLAAATGRRPADSAFRIVSPRDGDRYAAPPGVPAEYATVALRAAGAPAGAAVEWTVDGAPVAGGRLRLVPGRHTVRARTPRGDSAAVTVTVE